ncbi:hypothetical protein GRI62_11805 [Erythrobacter arachoides]|uniref:Uncharacterized protein n=1 Tax=Aurantiacibacter arachoides TaxID=1850444 RepID=A0A845A3Q9_9SPHN|nr:hypothetical protein [Aurantiacibacter arachoides]MXO94280.1 hypothetical protein [Aurantiacibacter arachoides]GGD64716.1 hypothetical protein GCM10011411_26280 [Aurantiacibacter arachoides]
MNIFEETIENDTAPATVTIDGDAYMMALTLLEESECPNAQYVRMKLRGAIVD